MMNRRAFSLIEVLMSVFILGIGVIAIASLLPAGIRQQRAARDTSVGPVVAQSAIGLLRSKYSQDTFGGDDLGFDCGAPSTSCQGGTGFTNDYFCHLAPGDFGWTRPARWSANALASVSVFDDAANQQVAFAPRGAVHPFIGPPSVQGQGGTDCMWWPSSDPNYPEAQSTLDPLDPCFNPFLSSGVGFINNQAPAPFSTRNIPVNDPDYPCGSIPLVDILGVTDVSALPPDGQKPFSWFIRQEERQWPIGASTPEYYWDCMFRRNNGVVEVAIFVYRVIGDQPGGLTDAVEDGYLCPGSRRPHGVWLPPAACESAPLFGENHFLLSGQTVVTNIQSQSPFDTSGPRYMNSQWQAPGQLILDEHGGVHRVVRGRPREGETRIEFADPLFTPPAERDLLNTQAGPDASERTPIRQIWFIPILERGGRRMEPVYISVETL